MPKQMIRCETGPFLSLSNFSRVGLNFWPDNAPVGVQNSLFVWNQQRSGFIRIRTVDIYYAIY